MLSQSSIQVPIHDYMISASTRRRLAEHFWKYQPNQFGCHMRRRQKSSIQCPFKQGSDYSWPSQRLKRTKKHNSSKKAYYWRLISTDPGGVERLWLQPSPTCDASLAGRTLLQHCRWSRRLSALEADTRQTGKINMAIRYLFKYSLSTLLTIL